MSYEPKTGSNARIRNRKKIEEYLKNHPRATGVEIRKALNLSLPTIYSHLKELTK